MSVGSRAARNHEAAVRQELAQGHATMRLGSWLRWKVTYSTARPTHVCRCLSNAVYKRGSFLPLLPSLSHNTAIYICPLCLSVCLSTFTSLQSSVCLFVCCFLSFTCFIHCKKLTSLEHNFPNFLSHVFKSILL